MRAFNRAESEAKICIMMKIYGLLINIAIKI